MHNILSNLKNKETRDGLKKYLQENNIPSIIYYTKTMHQQKAFSYLKNKDEDYPVSTELCNQVLSIPIHPYMTEENIENVSSKIREYMSKN